MHCSMVQTRSTANLGLLPTWRHCTILYRRTCGQPSRRYVQHTNKETSLGEKEQSVRRQVGICETLACVVQITLKDAVTVNTKLSTVRSLYDHRPSVIHANCTDGISIWKEMNHLHRRIAVRGNFPNLNRTSMGDTNESISIEAVTLNSSDTRVKVNLSSPSR